MGAAVVWRMPSFRARERDLGLDLEEDERDGERSRKSVARK